ncbi:MAG: hypothetical protein MJY84_08700 [Bacteroidales bacterium]|nr:hypothetical protein [Bacteroidales bacterium]
MDVIKFNKYPKTAGGGGGGGGSSAPMTSITWAELKSLRDSAGLTPGMQYRITDYECTTAQDLTRSAGHRFDIIVTADSADSLNENARACLHEGDSYFADSYLTAWELKYSLDNDSDRFAWASEDGKGVVYWMKDEWDNECPYDFKNIMFKGDWGYFAYTFNYINDSSDNSCEDISTQQFVHPGYGGDYCHTHDNVIKPYINTSGGYVLNVIVFLNMSSLYEGSWSGCFCNVFGVGSHNNTIGSHSNRNTFGIECWNNTLGRGCYHNHFSNYCYGNNIKDGGYYNSLGDYCYFNTIDAGASKKVLVMCSGVKSNLSGYVAAFWFGNTKRY